MVRILLIHGWKKFTRSFSYSRDATALGLTILLAIIFIIYTLALGFNLEVLIAEGLQQPDSLNFLNSVLFYYLGAEFMMRYMMQNLPVLDIQPYLHLRIKKSNLVHYLLIKSKVHLMNFVVPMLFAPFAFGVIAPAYGAASAWLWLINIWLMSFNVHFVLLLFKKALDDNIWGFIVFVGVIGLFGMADYFQWFKLSAVSAWLFHLPIGAPLFITIPLLFMLALYYVNFIFFLKHTYPEEIAFQRSTRLSNRQDFAFLKNLGTIGEVINVEIKLILRNKRPRQILFMSLLFLMYGLIFYEKDISQNQMPGIFLFVGIFITGIFMINYGQYLFSWQAGHWDFTLTQPLSARQYIESKYWLLGGVTLVCFVLTIPYVYFGWKIVLLHLATALYNFGINVFIIMNIAMWSPKKIDLRKGTAFNYEGVGAAQWLMSIPVILSPYVIYVPFNVAGHQDLGLLAVGLAGFIGMALRHKLIDITARRLMARKYSIAAGFRGR